MTGASISARDAAPRGGGDGVLGIDEAGRGSLLGPLVVGGFLIPEDRLGELRDLGVRDSKLLSPRRREEIFRGLAGLGRRLSVALPAPEVDAWVARGQLNALEARAFARLIRRARPARTFVDACDPVAPRFGRTVAALAAASGPVVARHRADRDLPVVGAASVVAKVTRDRAIARLRREVDEEVGSGYPADERTLTFVRAYLARDAGPAPWLRRSWSTMERVIPSPPRRALESFA